MSASDDPTTTVDTVGIRSRYLEQMPRYERVASLVKGHLVAAAGRLGIEPNVAARAKQPVNLVVKAIKKHAEDPDKYGDDPLEAMGDRAGARVIVAYSSDADAIVDDLRDHFDIIEVDEKREALAPDRLGYLGTHVQIRLRPEDLAEDDAALAGLECEVQIHTLAQHAWSTVSHPLLYKPAGAPPPVELQRRIYRATALVSLFDDEIATARDQIIGDPSYRAALMLDSLTKLCIDWCDLQPDDPEVSLEILRLVESAYKPEELDRVDDLLSQFVDERRDEISGVLELYEPNRDATEILFRPEAAAIYERLVNRPQKLRAVWQNSDLPVDWLNEVSAAFGVGTA
jgi:ppGpp synthetase/RelA/SpoT-type nucleotidyltranferase